MKTKQQTFNPFEEKGTPVEKQIHSWPEMSPTPYDKNEVHPYTRARIILMNGIEVEAALAKHQFARHTDDLELNQQVALTRRLEQQQQKMVNWLIPGDETPLEVTLGYEQVAVDLTAWLARTEPDLYVKAALDFALLEDFDHLYRYANLYELTEGRDAADIVGELTEITPGRPTFVEHRHPFDGERKPYDDQTADILTKLHVLTIVSGEQQTMNFYMNVGPQAKSTVGGGLYAEIAMIEEQHVSHYETLADPTVSWFNRLVLHEYNECYLYYSCMASEVDPRIKMFWEGHLSEEVEHLRLARELVKKYEKKDPAEMFPKSLPELTVFQSNKDYVREVLATQVGLTADGTEFVPFAEMTHKDRYEMWQQAVNRDLIPSQQVILDNVKKNGRDYRLETEGPNPVPALRAVRLATAAK